MSRGICAAQLRTCFASCSSKMIRVQPSRPPRAPPASIRPERACGLASRIPASRSAVSRRRSSPSHRRSRWTAGTPTHTASRSSHGDGRGDPASRPPHPPSASPRSPDAPHVRPRRARCTTGRHPRRRSPTQSLKSSTRVAWHPPAGQGPPRRRTCSSASPLTTATDFRPPAAVRAAGCEPRMRPIRRALGRVVDTCTRYLRLGATQEGPPGWRPFADRMNRRRPTLPGPCGPSTIGAERLNCSVRNGKRCFPLAVATGERRESPGPSKLHGSHRFCATSIKKSSVKPSTH